VVSQPEDVPQAIEKAPAWTADARTFATV
jgi:hypothetical protein